MDIASLTQALTRDAVWVVFLNVLLQQFGLPMPPIAGSLRMPLPSCTRPWS